MNKDVYNYVCLILCYLCFVEKNFFSVEVYIVMVIVLMVVGNVGYDIL